MGTDDKGGDSMGFQNRGENIMNWDPLVSLNQSENFGASSMVSHGEFINPAYLVQYQTDSGLANMVPKLSSCYGSGSYSEMGSLGLAECSQIANAGNEMGSPNVSDEGNLGASPNGKRRKRAPDSQALFKKAEEEPQNDLSGESSEFRKGKDENKQKNEHKTGENSRSKQMGKQVKDNSNSGESPKDGYIHVRARRGQATNSHSLAERVRREKISERMRLLQELVPGCNKITGKAVMLDEIINYVQSLQQQVEFLSMKLAAVNPEVNIDIDRLLSKDILHSRGLGFGPGISSSNPYPHGIHHGNLSIPTNAPQFHSMPQNLWDNNDLHGLLQMGFDSNPAAADDLGLNGCSKMEL